jgi:protoporphyrinogen oxidase
MGKNNILILGAGPAGMACAMELHKAGKNFILVEKESEVGGLSRTYKFGEFRTDNGPHRFFSKNKYLYDMIEDVLGEKWIKVNRFTRFYIDGKFYKYPVDLLSALLTMGPKKAASVIIDYLKEKVKPKKQPKNFEEYVVSKFGRSLAEFNILNYTRKVWGLECNKLSWEWGEQRIKGLSITAILKNSIMKKKGPKTLVDQFFYPDSGTGLIYEEIKKRIVEKNNDFLLNTEPKKIFINGRKIKRVKLSNLIEINNPNWVVSSIPINSLCQLLEPSPPKKVMEAVSKLKFRSQVYLFITLNKPSVSNDQWIYFPNTEIPIGRISEMRNFSVKMSPEGKTSLFIEFFCWKDDKIWKMKKDELLELVSEWLERLNFVKRNEIIDSYLIKKEYVYPVYDLYYKQNLKIVLDYLESIQNLICIGRLGRFKYTNQDHSLEMGIMAARTIIERKKYDIDTIGSENDYFERGYVK